MTARRRWLHGFIFASAITLPIAQGCGGNTAGVGDQGGDGGDDGSSSDSSASDGSAQDSSSSDPFCAAAASYVSRCDLTDACDVAKAAACEQDEAIASTGGIAAYEACESIEPCPGPAIADPDASTTRAYDQCLASNYGAPSASAETIAADYCAKCLPGVATCSTAFYDSKSNGVRLLALNDAILDEIDRKCLARDAGIELNCATDFDKCVRDVVASHAPPPAACADQ